VENRQKLRRQHRRHEGVRRKPGRSQEERKSARPYDRLYRLVACRAAVGGDAGMLARQREGMQGRGKSGEQYRIDKVSAAPSGRVDKNLHHRPTHRRSESSGRA
jgi:hypothetical protein